MKLYLYIKQNTKPNIKKSWGLNFREMLHTLDFITMMGVRGERERNRERGRAMKTER